MNFKTLINKLINLGLPEHYEILLLPKDEFQGEDEQFSSYKEIPDRCDGMFVTSYRVCNNISKVIFYVVW